MLASDAFLVGSLVFVAVVAVTVVSAAYLAWRGARRRLRALRRHTAVRSVAALWAVTRPGVLAVPLLGATRSTARARHELWRAVGTAERAVRHAAVIDSPVGDLPSLTRRLHDVGLDLDGLLAIADGLPPALPEVRSLRRQVDDVVQASDRIRHAALAAAGDAAATRAALLVADADREVRALAAGVARARDALPRVG